MFFHLSSFSITFGCFLNVLFLAKNKFGNAAMAVDLPNFISGLSMLFLTMLTPVHNYSFLGSKNISFDDFMEV